jgi:hypothetical protein
MGHRTHRCRICRKVVYRPWQQECKDCREALARIAQLRGPPDSAGPPHAELAQRLARYAQRAEQHLPLFG